MGAHALSLSPTETEWERDILAKKYWANEKKTQTLRSTMSTFYFSCQCNAVNLGSATDSLLMYNCSFSYIKDEDYLLLMASLGSLNCSKNVEKSMETCTLWCNEIFETFLVSFFCLIRKMSAFILSVDNFIFVDCVSLCFKCESIEFQHVNSIFIIKCHSS